MVRFRAGSRADPDAFDEAADETPPERPTGVPGKRLGDLLISRGVVQRGGFSEALLTQADSGQLLGELLVDGDSSMKATSLPRSLSSSAANSSTSVRSTRNPTRCCASRMT